MFEESARKLLKQLIKDGIVTDEMLEESGFMPHIIEDLKDDREWEQLYGHLSSYPHKEASDRVVSAVLGLDWKKEYEYKEYTDRNGYGLMLKVNKDEYDKICEAAREKYARL